MPIPLLLGLLGLAGGAYGQDAYGQMKAQDARREVKGLLGSAPGIDESLYGPPSPGTGLMADPADPRRQLEFAAGVMGMRPRDREAAAPLFNDIMARASQGALTREGWGRQQEAAALAESNVDRRWAADNFAAQGRFEQTHELARERFTTDKAQFGENAAWEKYKFTQSQAQGKLDYDLRVAQGQRDAARLQLERQRAANGGEGGLVKMPVGYRPVMVTGANGPEVVAAPVPGTPDWTKAQQQIDQVDMLRQNIEKFKASISAPTGFEKVGAGAGEQKQLWSRIVGALGGIDHLGTLQKSDLERIASELPDPTTILSAPVSKDFMRSQLDGLEAQARGEQEQAGYRYRGWGVRIPQRGRAGGSSGSSGGRDSPPAGSKPLGGQEGSIGG